MCVCICLPRSDGARTRQRDDGLLRAEQIGNGYFVSARGFRKNGEQRLSNRPTVPPLVGRASSMTYDSSSPSPRPGIHSGQPVCSEWTLTIDQQL
ncbi:unnamed protein product [Protopolystoma xenopodis]|uniref:Uncharacterized protein n=1 Tax=Protopolystoma xenopodis TaxID=117903 RepID=A0A3S5AEF7_9PLAT|nr:unnamed protein product [Protopolystoma xenopodis]